MIDLDDEAVVFHPLSWDAHVLNASAAHVLDFVLAAPRRCDEIEALLADALNADERDNAAAHAERLLGDLARLDLIRELRD